MKIVIHLSERTLESPAVKPFLIFRDRILPELQARRAELQTMYAPIMGRPEIDPAFLMAVTILQMMERLPDRQATTACLSDVRWRLALNIPAGWKGFDPTTLVRFRKRVVRDNKAKLAMDAGLDAMRKAGYLKGSREVRIDSTHVLGAVARMSRLECFRETLRQALIFLTVLGKGGSWDPWYSRYHDRNPEELRNAGVEGLKGAMAQAGRDASAILQRADALGDVVALSNPIALLRRVFAEQFQETEGKPEQRPASPAGAVVNPHDPDVNWSTKTSLGKEGWRGFKLQVCETAPEVVRKRGEPTEAVITAVLVQPAITSDHGSVPPVLAVQAGNGEPPPKTVFTDAGYISGPALQNATQNGFDLCGPAPAPPYSEKRFGSDSFSVDIPNRRAVCPAGKSSVECSSIQESNSKLPYHYFAWSQTDCSSCPLKDQCLSTKKKRPFRTLQVGAFHMTVQERRRLAKTHEYKSRMHRRSGIEGTNSEIKRGYGIRRARYRGLAKFDLQSQTTAVACNIRRWAVRSCWLARQAKHTM
jgi:IS5 family transposase